MLGKVAKNTCNYCGAVLDLSAAKEMEITPDVDSAAKDALSFQKALVADVNGKTASITDMWQSLVSNRDIPREKLINFFKNLKNFTPCSLKLINLIHSRGNIFSISITH